MNANFWRGKRVLLTGHTGFKGSWLSLWLQRLGAVVAGYALPPPTSDNLFDLASIAEHMTQSVYADIRCEQSLEKLFDSFQPEIVFHLAAQALVRRSYAEPVETYDVNVMGTIHVLEAVRKARSCRVVVNVTSDKCYENTEGAWGYRENDQMGGHDPYSSSKGCAELVTAAYRRSFFASESTRVGIASARAGNVIGGGDFSKDRIVPDFVAAATQGHTLYIRYPDAVRPWQHVLEPLSGYLLLAERLWTDPVEYAQGWNFGPTHSDVRSVRWIVERLNDYWGRPITWQVDELPKPHEARLLMLDSTKARMMLGWQPRWSLEQALRQVVRWHSAHQQGEPIRAIALQQIASYEAALTADQLDDRDTQQERISALLKENA